MTMALEGLKVLDLGRTPMTLLCSVILGDLGAEVIWVQDATPERSSPDDAARYAAFNARVRNKRSIGLDLRQAAAQAVFQRLAQDADVVMEGFRPGVMKRLGADYETLSALNPRLVYCSVSGFGQTGPYRDFPGHDNSYSATAGAMGLIGEKGGRPVPAYNLLADNASGGVLSCVGVLAALLAREKTGRGQYLDLSMTDGVAYIMGHVYSDYFRSGQVPRRGEAASSGGLAQYSVYEAADGKYISIAALEAKFFESLCGMLGRPDFIGNAGSPERQAELRVLLAQTFRQKTRDEWFETLTRAEIPAGKVYSVDESPDDPQLQAREMFIDLSDERVGPVRQIGLPLKFSETPGSVRSLGPTKGQHTLEVLQGMGYGEDEIEALKQSGAVLIGG